MQLNRPDCTAHWFPLQQMRALALAGDGARMEEAAETSAAPPAGSVALHVAQLGDKRRRPRAFDSRGAFLRWLAPEDIETVARLQVRDQATVNKHDASSVLIPTMWGHWAYALLLHLSPASSPYVKSLMLLLYERAALSSFDATKIMNQVLLTS